VVVTVGETLTGDPLVAGRLPGVIMPVPLEKTPVRLVELPDVMLAGLAMKLVMVGGAGVTVTVTVFVIAVPLVGVTVRV
jgi:hypothetical protein